MLTAERARQLLAYDPETGVLTWRVRRGGRASAGSIAGSLDANGYRHVYVDGRSYYAHRLVWLIVHGRWPDGEIDHREPTRKGDNRLANLREGSRSDQGANTHRPRHNSSGFKGVCWDKQTGKWRAQLQVRGERVPLGRFATPEDAHAAYVAAARLHFGDFARGS